MRIRVNKCGTISGYTNHHTDKTTVCQPCRDAAKEYNKRYYAANKDKIDKARKSWRLANPEKVRKIDRTKHRKRRALKLENGHEPYKEEQVLLTYGELCNICGTQIDLNAPRQAGIVGWEKGLHIDHLIPISKYRPGTLTNVRPTHALCNLKKGASL